MKLRIYTAVNLLLLALSSYACGWFPQDAGNVWLYRIMPLNESRYGDYCTMWDCDWMLHPTVDYKEENIRLWQQQTSPSVSLADIEIVVYKADINFLQHLVDKTGENGFARWIVQNKRDDIVQLLIIAKQNEAINNHMTAPWYYRVEDDKNFQRLEEIAEECIKHKSGQLLGRYALQAMRALCNLRRYDECARYWDAVKDRIPQDVVRTMCELKAASALHKTGREDEALNIYVRHGDLPSIRAINNGRIDNELQFIYNHNPNSPYIEGELQKWLLYFGAEYEKTAFANGNASWDEHYMDNLLSVARQAVREKRSRKLAMWYYTLAALYDVKGQSRRAQRYLHLGMNYRKDAFLHDSYRVLRMWLDAQTMPCDSAYETQLEKDVRWLVAKAERNKTTAFDSLIVEPSKHYKEEYYYDYYPWNYYQDWSNSFYWNDALRRLLLRGVCPKMHKAGKYIREIQLANLAENLFIQVNDYSNEMFLIMDRLPYRVTRDYFARIYHPKDDFDRFLNSKGKTDKYYWYDILATKCLRERRYEKALIYLRQVPVAYQRKMNVYSYMDYNPFSYDMQTFKHDSSLRDDCKLHFAEKMAEYKQVMNHDENADRRADAKIQYALGLRNSVYKCWFLTCYSSNMDDDYIRYAVPDIPYPDDSLVYRHKEYMAMSDRLIHQAIDTYRDKEKAARQLQRLLYFRRIVDEFPETQTAADVRQHCDRWRDYASSK